MMPHHARFAVIIMSRLSFSFSFSPSVENFPLREARSLWCGSEVSACFGKHKKWYHEAKEQEGIKYHVYAIIQHLNYCFRYIECLKNIPLWRIVFRGPPEIETKGKGIVEGLTRAIFVRRLAELASPCILRMSRSACAGRRTECNPFMSSRKDQQKLNRKFGLITLNRHLFNLCGSEHRTLRNLLFMLFLLLHLLPCTLGRPFPVTSHHLQLQRAENAIILNYSLLRFDFSAHAPEVPSGRR